MPKIGFFGRSDLTGMYVCLCIYVYLSMYVCTCRSR